MIHLKKPLTIKTILASFALLFALSLLAYGARLSEPTDWMPQDYAPSDNSYEHARSRYFNNASLKGRYASLATAITPDAGKTSYTACVGLVTFDGFGNFTDQETHSFNGEIVRQEYRGTYHINPNGTGTMTYFDANGPTNPCPIVLSDGGKEVTFIVTQPGIVSTGVLKKQ